MPAARGSNPGCEITSDCPTPRESPLDVAFGTYHRDGVNTYLGWQPYGLDSAQNRHYAPSRGRFTTPDPYDKYFDLKNPLSFNRHAYVTGDPINKNDPKGFCADDVSGDGSSDSSGDDS
jgi:RHS repeat-associated protein